MTTPVLIQPSPDEMRKLAEAGGLAKEQFAIAREILKHSYPGQATNAELMSAVLGAVATNYAALTRRS